MGFHEETDLDKLTLTVPQLALLPYGLAGFLGTFLAFPCGLTPFGELGALLLFLVGPALFVLGVSYAPTARIELTATELRIDAWAGWPFPRPSQLRLPLHRVEVSWSKGRSRVNGREVRGLNLHVPGGEPVHLPALRISREEHDLLSERIEGMRALAQARFGDGVEEVPDELSQIRSSERPSRDRE